MRLSIIIPVLNEAASIETHLRPLQDFRAAGHELILVDGGSEDGTLALATPWVDKAIISEPGRARQMMAGANLAEGDVLLFLHADTRLPSDAEALLQAASHEGSWGRFDVRLSGQHWMFPIIAWFMNHRSRLTGIATGDQAIFVRRSLFLAMGGFANIPLMEDVELCKRLKVHSPPVCIDTPLETSSRRWQSAGVFRTIFLMWKLRLLYFLGVSTQSLARQYRKQN
ncbi:TIGR04283 family arsenosugar biosynthesis glycosyltransferase [Aestuariirhabdus sp. Z084]|uniref:TIGR04283 family arsenosugar biosynthesis glycosyltransferase n=1 Tax=Aestuariirhabdus haliotis TaxID=2918751 RepID=UPI00201B4078|nr:TIGR04283 family arsenosugar biosynthesis glycosyltransferase [Aestuariirhabdus haliotis]MCL6414432.1 TIGR04283 family arsenosugar biosynthesis glycosyltransferase [Aestuariirhabdus haliotis]MCL6418586.1 TIGR04283 family arsenosugar biosynthesis glycosyltransferase [Aestuariirhabdus haliotis]